ncbi:MFS transporter [Paenibacillus sp. MBLB4367]|uniref:MFS transporter n=1 Tax=Paenibacillus sp. MBLB4367 TaxID=3384767 RepID=UPI00390826F9
MKPANRKFVLTYLLFSLYGVILTMLLDSSISASLIMILGGNPSQAGSVDSLVNLGAILSAVFSAYLLSKFRHYKKMFILFSFFSLTSIAGLALSLYMPVPAVVIYIVLFSIFAYYFCVGSLSLPLYELLNRNVDSRSRVVVMSNSLAIGQLCSTVVSVGIQWVLGRPAAGTIANYHILFIFAAIVAALHLLTTLMLDKVPVNGGEAGNRATFASLYREEWTAIKRQPYFRVFFAAVILFAFCWSATGLYISLGFRENAARMKDILASGIFIRTVVKACSYYVCGQLARRYGNKAILLAIGIVGLGSPFTALFLPLDYFIIVLIATNLAPMAYVYFLNDLFERSDGTTFKGHFTLFTLAAIPATLSIPLFGLLIDRQPAAFGLVMAMLQLGGLFFVARLRPAIAQQSLNHKDSEDA